MACAAKFVSTWRAVTCAPATTAPDGSTTRPPTLAYSTDCCAAAVPADVSMTIANTIAATLRTGTPPRETKQPAGSAFRRTIRDRPRATGLDRCDYARGGGGSGGTERKVTVEVESIDVVVIAAGTGADVIAGMRPAAWNSDPRVANVSSALPIRQILEPGPERWCIGQIACSPCAHVHSAVSSCADASSTIDGAISSAVCITSHSVVRRTSASRTRLIEATVVLPDRRVKFHPGAQERSA